ncbi:MAG: carboxymuconolactone decarboxylase family protein [Streptococcaceae bacterium]|jgi:alkylhydroperoxidase/carboxymuconolactone decarboxylase family protein YurZ|nr:carboxymuconolactone decarboxylase family protein [Streptococcaceae bacterium]MCH4176232.1 carboxymuconolactone decarboxylase family protein [Streptococcaceae bacterium]
MANLDNKQVNLITTAVYATLGNLEHLKIAFAKALDEGMTINEAKEAMLHVYAYAGFPRSINATNVLRVLIDDRAAAGEKDTQGVASSELSANIDKNKYGEEVRTSLTGPRPQPAYAKFSPALDDFLKEHLFADLFSRETLTKLERELITISVLAALQNVPAQLETHMKIAQSVGLTDEQVTAFNKTIFELLTNDN